MTDSLNIVGNTIEFGPYVVGSLATDIPATIREQVEGELMHDPLAFYTETDLTDEYDRGFREGRDAGEAEEKALVEQINRLRDIIDELQGAKRDFCAACNHSRIRHCASPEYCGYEENG